MRQILLVFVCIAQLSWGYETLIVERVISVYDGDSFRVDIGGLHPLIGENIPIRVAGVDTPEIRGKCESEKLLAKQAKALTKAMLENGRNIELRSPERGKYFRIVADVWVDGKSLKNALLGANLAYPYDGGKKQTWCAQL